MFTNRAFTAILAVVGASACGAADEAGLESSRESVVVGNNDLVEFAAVSDPRLKALADSTGAIFLGDRVSCSSGTCSLFVNLFNQAETPTANSSIPGGPPTRHLCPGEPFRDQPYGSVCSAFLVGPDLFATAGHCLCSTSGSCGCNDRKVVFGFKADAAGQNTQWNVPEANVYSCVGTPQAHYGNGEDWAFFRVDRPVASRAPMIVQRTGALLSGELAISGHPNGLPLKVARNGQVKVDSPTEPIKFFTSLDSYTGSSGAPVIDIATGVVTGIHVTAPYWNYIDGTDGSGNLCAKTNVCNATTGCDPILAFSRWGGETRMTYAAAQGKVPLHPALIVATQM